MTRAMSAARIPRLLRSRAMRVSRAQDTTATRRNISWYCPLSTSSGMSSTQYAPSARAARSSILARIGGCRIASNCLRRSSDENTISLQFFAVYRSARVFDFFAETFHDRVNLLAPRRREFARNRVRVNDRYAKFGEAVRDRRSCRCRCRRSARLWRPPARSSLLWNSAPWSAKHSNISPARHARNHANSPALCYIHRILPPAMRPHGAP